jgi:hypothetical protein
MELNMNRIFVTLVSAAIVGLSPMIGRAAEAPRQPQVNFIAASANQLELGMTEHDVISILGKTAKETDLAIGSTRIRKLEFADAIQAQLIFTDGKLSRISVDPFRRQEAALPSFIRRAWPGVASRVVRRVLGEPAAILHHELFGIEVDQWIFLRPGEAEASVFFRADRVIARAAGREVPPDIFRVDLPSPPQAESEGPLSKPHVGMTSRDIVEHYGAAKFRVDYVCNGQPASREVYEIAGDDTLVGLTVIDGIITELEIFGGRDDAMLQGR